ncbi:hypothetical protein G6F57_008460 [Rhizopus arrhizus]|uniref:Allantoicase domain-containing protein n=1 Tax=Rhizopus oryzae TaxID=64495 RepID=A0A9P6X596_RHIOR|nr:hypothetical protein G6F23_002783 [Rhizopus arrhizus]KAG1421764.1 hypothetical protein G6F58_003612 [Rhizopus delemar]KAG0761303.1 hypothetical protein G6F24_007672 [Rhizopus arrhizus]KAG0909084.1 hypothetical protein G6F33_009111 [Rhizopus arrhizus]KAG0950049.1 hypothetical protein G6F30_001895 [Rhizopus arrhizus]
MGNNLSRTNYIKIDAKDIKETRLDDYAELTSATRNSRIEYVSDEYYGKAENLLKQQNPDTSHSLYQEGTKDGWQVRRHQATACVVITLGCTGTITGFDIDTTGFMDASPSNVLVEGYIENQREEGKWIILLPNVPIEMNSHNFYMIQHDPHIYSRLRLTTAPGGGIARFRCYGQVLPVWTNLNHEYNLASANLGSQIVRWTDAEYANKPNILLDSGTSQLDGWLTPRSRLEPRNDFVVIQLATTGILSAIVIDTSGFEGNSPSHIQIDGYPYMDPSVEWFTLIKATPCQPNDKTVHPIIYGLPVSHLKLTLFPDGGIQQVQALGIPYVKNDEEDAVLTTNENEAMIREEEKEQEAEKELDHQISKEINCLLFPKSSDNTTIVKTITTKKRKSIELTERSVLNKPSKAPDTKPNRTSKRIKSKLT